MPPSIHGNLTQRTQLGGEIICWRHMLSRFIRVQLAGIDFPVQRAPLLEFTRCVSMSFPVIVLPSSCSLPPLSRLSHFSWPSLYAIGLFPCPRVRDSFQKKEEVLMTNRRPCAYVLLEEKGPLLAQWALYLFAYHDKG